MGYIGFGFWFLWRFSCAPPPPWGGAGRAARPARPPHFVFDQSAFPFPPSACACPGGAACRPTPTRPSAHASAQGPRSDWLTLDRPSETTPGGRS